MKTEQYFRDWEKIIDGVDKTQYPMEFVNSVTFNVAPGSNTDYSTRINIQELREMGYDENSLKDIIAETLDEFPEEEGVMEFNLDIAGIAKIAEAETEKYLKETM